MIKKLRDFHDAETLAKIYAKPHDHRIYGRGHNLRVEITKNIFRDAVYEAKAKSVGDLSCGNGEIALSSDVPDVHLGDFAPGYKYQGPLDKTLLKMPNVDVYVCSESLEHVEAPLSILEQIRGKARYLVLSTPIENWEDTNKEHYWAWDRSGIESFLAETRWTPDVFTLLDTTVFGEPYKYGIWCCK